MPDSPSDSETDLVSAISRCRKRARTSLSSSSVATWPLPQYSARSCGAATGSSFADQLSRCSHRLRRQRPVLRDIGFDKGLLPLVGGAESGAGASPQVDLSLRLREGGATEPMNDAVDDGDDTAGGVDGDDNEEVIVIDRATFGQGRAAQVKHEPSTTADQVKHEHGVNEVKKEFNAGANLVQRQSNSSATSSGGRARVTKSESQAADVKAATEIAKNNNGESRKKEDAQIESLLLVLLDVWDNLAPTHRNTLINIYGAHYEALLLREEDCPSSSNTLLHAGSRGGDMETCDGDESSSAAELRETIASSRQCLAKQLTHARQFFTSTLGNAELLKHASTAERLTSWRYIVRITKSATRLSDLGQTKSKNFSAPFDDYEAAKHFLKGLIVTQMETDEGCICKHSAKSRPDRDVPFLERFKGKQRMANTKKTECRIEKIKLPRHCYEVYEKKHHKGMFLYWYIDVEVSGRGPNDAEMPDVHGVLANRGDAVPKSKTAGMYVVIGQIYTVSSTSLDTLGPNTAGLTEAGPSRIRRAALSPAMSISRLPESVWTTCKLANEAAYSLITAHTKVNEFMRTEEDERTWRSLIRPVIDQEWEKRGYKVVSSGSPVFKCTLEIPDILRDRLGYDTISVDVICIKRARQAEKKSNKRKADAAEMDGEQQNSQADS